MGTLAMAGAAACGPSAVQRGAPTCSCMNHPRPPSRAAVVCGQSGVWWSRWRREGPMPRASHRAAVAIWCIPTLPTEATKRTSTQTPTSQTTSLARVSTERRSLMLTVAVFLGATSSLQMLPCFSLAIEARRARGGSTPCDILLHIIDITIGILTRLTIECWSELPNPTPWSVKVHSTGFVRAGRWEWAREGAAVACRATWVPKSIAAAVIFEVLRGRIVAITVRRGTVRMQT